MKSDEGEKCIGTLLPGHLRESVICRIAQVSEEGSEKRYTPSRSGPCIRYGMARLHGDISAPPLSPHVCIRYTHACVCLQPAGSGFKCFQTGKLLLPYGVYSFGYLGKQTRSGYNISVHCEREAASIAVEGMSYLGRRQALRC